MVATGKRYRAFLSYSQRDKSVAKRLHRALESYRVPNGLAVAGLEAKSRRIGRIFRDDEEMSAASDLGAALRGAIDDSDALIVVCSPHAAQSPWVNEEVAHFKKSGRADRIFAVIVDGEPNTAYPDQQCFPPALRFEVDASGAVTDRPSEPLGLDLRRESFARLRARLVTGLLGIPFDDLWKRDERRRQQSALLRFASGAAVAGAIALAVLAWRNEREQARAQEVEQALAAARVEAGEGRVAQALSRLAPYLGGGQAARVEPTLRAVLGWAQPVAEQIAAIGMPRLASYRGALVFADAQGGLHDLSEVGVAPRRVILARDLRRLVIIGDYHTFVVDTQNGATLAQINNGGVDWNSFAFETPQGLIVVLGTRYGSTNGSIVHAALSVSVDGATAKSKQVSPFVSLQGVWTSGACQALVVTRRDEGALALPFGDSGVGEETPYGDYSAAHPERVVQVIWQPGEQNTLDNSLFGARADGWRIANRNPFTAAGCVAVTADNGTSDLDPNVVHVAQVGAQSIGVTWETLRQIPTLYRAAPTPADHWMPEAFDVQRSNGLSIWRSLPTPRGIAPELAGFDAVDGQVLTFGEDRANAGVTWYVCGARCVEVAVLHDEARSYEVVRSPDGAHLLLAQAGAIIDLMRLELVTGLRELPTGAGTAFDFEPDVSQLAIVDGGEIVAYRPDADGRWRRAARTALASLSSSEIEREVGGDYAGLMALGGGTYLVAEQNAQVTRVAPDGRIAWRINFFGLETVVGLRYSSNRRYAALVAENGLRIIDAETGLALSGVLTPAGWTRSDAHGCQNGIHVGDDSSVRVICQTYDDNAPRAAYWQARPYDGAIPPRLAAMLCDADARSSPVAALERCRTQ